jgi:hypothetical protein
MSGASFYADPAVGGSGTTYEQSDFESGTYVTQFFDALEDEVNIATNAKTSATSAAASALTAINAPGTSSVSTTSNSLASSGDKTFTVEAGKAWVPGQYVRAARTSAPATSYMSGIVKTYSGTTLVITMDSSSGAGGPFTDWTISLSASASTAGLVPTSRQVLTGGIATGGDDLTADVTITVTAAVDTDIWAGSSTSKAVTPDALKDSAAPVALSDGATITPDLAAGADFTVTIAASRTLANMSNKVVGRKGVIIVTMGGSGGYSFTLGSDYKKLSTFALASGVGEVTRIDYHVVSASVVHLVSSGPYA